MTSIKQWHNVWDIDLISGPITGLEKRITDAVKLELKRLNDRKNKYCTGEKALPDWQSTGELSIVEGWEDISFRFQIERELSPREEEMRLKKLATSRKAAATRKAKQEQKEREQYEKLHAKFGAASLSDES